MQRWLAVLLIILGTFLLTAVLVFPLLGLWLENSSTAIVSPQSFKTMVNGREGWPFVDLRESTPAVVPSEFLLTIGKLGIQSARVFTDVRVAVPDDYRELLRRGLGHVKNTAYPGQWGAAFIIGHSSLPFFYDPANYETIFSTLDRLEAGDEIRLVFGEAVLVYRVTGQKIVDDWRRPEDVLSGGGFKLVLMTCYPPGLTLRRLLVIAELVKEEP